MERIINGGVGGRFFRLVKVSFVWKDFFGQRIL